MKNLKLLLILLISFSLFNCGGDDTEEVLIDTSTPNGTLAVERSGSIVSQNDTGSQGTVELGTDNDGTHFLHFGTDFETSLSTGTVTVFFSTSDTYTTDPANGNPDLIQVGPVLENGEKFFKLNGEVPTEFTHVILWCGSAQIPFGNAELN